MNDSTQRLIASPADFTHDFAERLPALARECQGEDQPDPRLVILNETLALELGIDPDWLRSPDGLRFLLGQAVPAHALGYAGFQFGQFNPRMGDGRALLLGEVRTPDGLRDLHAKGTGLTPWSRFGSDGRGTLRAMLREYLLSEAMAALGIPTTRGLAVIATGRTLRRQEVEPAGVHVRVAASHLRIGSLHYAAGIGQLREVADYCIERHYPGADYREFFLRALAAQQRTVAAWMRVGFIHGVMNTDNTTLSGQTIDYGPAAFMEAFDPGTCYSSIDSQGRYAFGNQPAMLGWNFARLAESLLPLFDAAPESALRFAEGALEHYHADFDAEYHRQLREHLGVEDPQAYLADIAGQDLTAYNARLDGPRVIPRNLNVEAALRDPAEFRELLAAVTNPFEPNPRYETPGDLGGYRTYCGT